ncbi:MAG: family 10 glycosylhydrolase, partial [Planctomycetes bacterium]|nr:family 10 glycosylhydrolase [Planctomycetota bacterium]
RLGQVLYPSKFLDPLVNADFQKWRDLGIDPVGRLLAEARKRGLESFWHHRISEVDLNTSGTGAAWKDVASPLKQAHPDWVLKTAWWRHGLWNLAVPAVREHTVRALREVAEMYDLDGVQIDFARHVPCLPPGRQWELRDHVTELMRMTRHMAQEVATGRQRPLLVAAKVPRNLEGCRVDGFDVEVWAKENLVDIFTLGSRSADVDVAAFRRVTAGRNIKLHPCFDDHHTTDGYRYPPIEVFRGLFANWHQQGADAVATFNWSNAPPEVCEQLGLRPGPRSHEEAYREVGSPEAMQFEDKTFFVERRGGYPWAEGFFNRNDTARLPLELARTGDEATLPVPIADDLGQHADRVQSVLLRVVLFRARSNEPVEATLNGVALPLAARDSEWKDPQIFSPKPQPASGGSGDYRVNPRQRLLRLDFTVDPRRCRLGENVASIRLSGPAAEGGSDAAVVLEKLELHVRYG